MRNIARNKRRAFSVTLGKFLGDDTVPGDIRTDAPPDVFGIASELTLDHPDVSSENAARVINPAVLDSLARSVPWPGYPVDLERNLYELSQAVCGSNQ